MASGSWGVVVVQVLRGSDRLNKLSNTNAFSTAIVDRLTAKSMHDVSRDQEWSRIVF
jgi:hypothetical protein